MLRAIRNLIIPLSINNYKKEQLDELKEKILFDVSDNSNLKLIVNTLHSESDTDIKVKSLLEQII